MLTTYIFKKVVGIATYLSVIKKVNTMLTNLLQRMEENLWETGSHKLEGKAS